MPNITAPKTRLIQQDITSEEKQKFSSPNMPLGHETYFELKALEKQQMQEGTLIHLLLPENRSSNSHVSESSLNHKEGSHLTSKDEPQGIN